MDFLSLVVMVESRQPFHQAPAEDDEGSHGDDDHNDLCPQWKFIEYLAEEGAGCAQALCHTTTHGGMGVFSYLAINISLTVVFVQSQARPLY